jgi:conjugative transfer signal peptidase TraF
MTDPAQRSRLRRLASHWPRFKRYFWPDMASILMGMVVASLAFPPPVLFVWNASPSAPMGLYYVDSYHHVHGEDNIKPGDMVVAWAPLSARKLAAARHYVPFNVPLVKRVAAAEHDWVCGDDDVVIIDGGWIIPRLRADSKGRSLPQWQGCRTLQHGELFLMMEEHPDSFDGRYFGVTEPQDVIGKAHLIWPTR